MMSTESPEELYRRENAKRGYPMRPLARCRDREPKCPECEATNPVVTRLARVEGGKARLECRKCHYSWRSVARAFQPGAILKPEVRG